MIAAFVFMALILPDRTLTPGATRPLSKVAICSTAWGKDVRHVTEAMKVEVAIAYGIKRSSIVGYGKGPCCEFDHLVSRKLGGADDIKNLWPQRWSDAKKKDALENRLNRLSCAGTIALDEAQRAIRTDWASAYRKYVLGDVRPRRATLDHPDQGSRHAVPLGQLDASQPGGTKTPDLSDGFFGELGGWSIGTSRDALRVPDRASATLRRHVLHVVLVRPKKQMIRVHARGDVAAMAHAHFVRDRTVLEDPRDAVGSSLFQLHVVERAITVGQKRTGPQPASLGLIDVFPEAIDRIASQRNTSAFAATDVACAPRDDLRWLSRERGATDLALEGDGCFQLVSGASAGDYTSTQRLLHGPEGTTAVAHTFNKSSWVLSAATNFAPACGGQLSEAFPSDNLRAPHDYRW